MLRESVPLGSTENLPYKATLQRLKDIADLPNTNTEKQTKWGDKET